MRFSAAALLALVSAVFAQTEGFDVVSKPSDGEKVPAGKTYEIVWAPDAKYADKPVDIILIGGPTQPKQQVLDTLAKDIPSSAGSYKWEVDDSLGKEKVYGIKIQLQEDPTIFQYSFPFAITPAEGNGDHSSAPASSAPSSTASSSKTKTHSSKSSDYPTASPSSESSTFSSVYVTSSGVPSSITSAASTAPTGTSTKATSTTATSTTVATGAATAFGANGFAVLGGLAMAALAL